MSQNTVWTPGSPNITNGQIKIGNPPTGASRNNIQTDWVRLNPNSANPAVKNLEYRVNNSNVVEFRYPATNDPNGPKSTANSIQEIADDKFVVAAYGYTPATTQLIQDALRRELTTQANSIGWQSSVAAPTAPQGDQQGGNSPTPPPGGGDGGGDDDGGSDNSDNGVPAPELPPPFNPNPQTIELKEKNLPIVPIDGRVQYPKLMRKEQDKIKFTAVKIAPKTLTDGDGLGFRFPGPVYEKAGGNVFIAIQSPISDQNGVDWGSDSVNAIDAALFKASVQFMGIDSVDGASNTVKNILNNIYQTANQQSERIKRALGGQAAGINNVLARTDSAILNPNMELLFQGPQLRPFSFQFRMTARSIDEARDIKTIIKYFKYHMAVREEKDDLFLRAPNVFTIQYMKGDDRPNHPGINIISPTELTKACALTNFSVDYTPLGTYMTYIDNERKPDDPGNGTMVAYNLSMQFQEITPIYDTDYVKYQDHPIGF